MPYCVLLSLLLFFHTISRSAMPFICKKPCVVPRVLCASQCPPHNILHDILDYPFYYEPIYFPEYYASLFATKQSCCVWLLNGLKHHSLNCCAHSQSISHIVVTSDDSDSCRSATSSFFHFFIDGVHFSVPFFYIESPLFS